MKHPIHCTEIAWAERERREGRMASERGVSEVKNRRETAKMMQLLSFRRFICSKLLKLQVTESELQITD